MADIVSEIDFLPNWAGELKQRYLRGETALFVLYGNVHDLVIYKQNLIGAPDFIAYGVLEKKELIIRYNVSTGCRAIKRSTAPTGLEELLVHRAPSRVLPALEQLLFTHKNMALIIDYAEMVAPEGSTAFASEQDRLAVVMLQRWSLAPQLDAGDNVVILLTEALNELHPKIVANPRVAAVKLPMPTREERRRVIQLINPDLDVVGLERFTEVTAGLKALQLRSLLQPPHPAVEDATARLRFISSLVDNERRARKLAALTKGMSREEIRELIGADPAEARQDSSIDDAIQDVLYRVARRKREILERECAGLIEFVDPAHDFSVVGGIAEIKRELQIVARNIREGNTRRVPMGLLFTGPMGTGKTFVAEAFVKESGLTGIKLKNFRSKWVGATESNLERILDVVRAIGNVIVIIDEGDRSLGTSEGGESDSGTSSRVIARLKEFMSDTANRGRVLFIVMTNRPDKLDIDLKRAGRLDRKIPFFYPQSAEEVESVLEALCRKHQLRPDLQFPRDRARISERLIGFSNADLEALALLANDYAAEPENAAAKIINAELFVRAIEDYLPSRDVEMLEYMELLAVFEASNRRMLPPKYTNLSIEALQFRLAELRLSCGKRR